MAELRSLDEMRRSTLESCAARGTIVIEYDRVPDLAGNMRAVLAFPGHAEPVVYSLPPLQLETAVIETLDRIMEHVGGVDGKSMLGCLFHFIVACKNAAREMEARVKSEGPAR